MSEPIHDYIVGLARRLCSKPRPNLLDYGCGAGEVVELARAQGLKAYGVDLFYEGGSYRTRAEESGLLGERIFELKNGAIPFPDGAFDVVVANQVFEHIEDFATPLAEIARVLEANGVFINLFPTREVWREGHLGIPFVHRFAKDSRLRAFYTAGLRHAGLGTFKDRRSVVEWTEQSLDWLDRWTHYKGVGEVRAIFESRFALEDFSADYLAHRLERFRLLGWLAPLLRSPPGSGLAAFLCHRLAGRVFVLRKR